MNWMLFIPGVVLGFFGWLLYWAGVPVIGGIVGGGAGASLGYIASGMIQQSWALPVFSGLGLVLGAVAGVMLMRLFQVYFFFITGAALGGAIGTMLINQTPLGEMAGPINSLGGFLVIVACAVGLGLLMVNWRRFIVAIVTSVIGSALVGAALPLEYQALGSILSFAIFASIQIGLVKKYVDKEQFDRRTRYRLREESPIVE